VPQLFGSDDVRMAAVPRIRTAAGAGTREPQEETMRRTTLQVRRGVFGAAVALTLGFGGSQALASPAPEVEEGPKCTLNWCDRFCKAIGARSGTCLKDEGCACAL
jgi:hypothetical protein